MTHLTKNEIQIPKFSKIIFISEVKLRRSQQKGVLQNSRSTLMTKPFRKYLSRSLFLEMSCDFIKHKLLHMYLLNVFATGVK